MTTAVERGVVVPPGAAASAPVRAWRRVRVTGTVVSDGGVSIALRAGRRVRRRRGRGSAGQSIVNDTTAPSLRRSRLGGICKICSLPRRVPLLRLDGHGPSESAEPMRIGAALRWKAAFTDERGRCNRWRRRAGRPRNRAGDDRTDADGRYSMRSLAVYGRQGTEAPAADFSLPASPLVGRRVTHRCVTRNRRRITAVGREAS